MQCMSHHLVNKVTVVLRSNNSFIYGTNYLYDAFRKCPNMKILAGHTRKNMSNIFLVIFSKLRKLREGLVTEAFVSVHLSFYMVFARTWIMPHEVFYKNYVIICCTRHISR